MLPSTIWDRQTVEVTLATVNLLGRKKGQQEADHDVTVIPVTPDDSELDAASRAVRRTSPKGRPTPKRSEAAKRAAKKGPIAPAPMTSAEARARRKALKGPKLDREERKTERVANRARMTDRRERMMAGEEEFLLPRDQGPVRRYARDIVDARRNLLGLFMPSALFLLFISMAIQVLQLYISPVMFALMVVMGIDAVFLGRKVSRRVDEKFPENTESRWKLGLYAAGRASQIRRMRAPRPQVKRGAHVD